MRKFIGAFALVLSALAGTPSLAQDGIPPEEDRKEQPGTVNTTRIPSGWYVGGEFGAMIVEDTSVDIGAVDDALRLSHEYGYDGGLFVGYDLGGFRIEAEAAYKKAKLESYTTSIRLPGEGINFATGRTFAGGSSSALSFMVNGMLDFGEHEKKGDISGFVGGGVGMARVKANNQRVFANTAPFLDDSDSKLAWQVFAGVRHAITDDIDVTVKYRFFNVSDVRMTAFNGNEAEMRFRSHSLLGGITFRFGKTKRERICREGPPIPVSAKCPDDVDVVCRPSPPLTLDKSINRCVCPTKGDTYDAATQQCKPIEVCQYPLVKRPEGCVMVSTELFFGWYKHIIGETSSKDTPGDRTFIVQSNESAFRILNEAAAYAKDHPAFEILIVGHADRSGPNHVNDPLSCRRANETRKHLESLGVQTGRITIGGRGEVENKVPTADGVREVQNRRAVISFGEALTPPHLDCTALLMQ